MPSEVVRGVQGVPADTLRNVSPATAPGSIEADPQTLRIGPDRPYSTVSDAIAASRPGDTLRIAPAIYTEYNLEITHPLTLLGEGTPASPVVIDGGGNGFILIVRADSVTIRGLTLRNTGRSYVHDYAALLLEDAADFVVEDNFVTDTFFGIYLARTTRGVIRGNQVVGFDTREASSGNGIHLWSVVEPAIHDNQIVGMRDGIYLEFVKDADIRGNVSNYNNRYGLHYMFSNGGKYYRNTLRGNGAGVAVMYSDHVDMSHNVFIHNWGPAAYGLLLKDIRHSTIEHNLFERNTIAVYLEGVSHTKLQHNQINANGWAVNIKSNSMDNTFSGNNFMSNSQDVRTDSPRNPNTWHGNYWSSYEGYDLDRDGIGDVPYRPVSLFSVIIERQPVSLILMRSLFVQLLDTAERMMPVLTPKALFDDEPRIRPFSVAPVVEAPLPAHLERNLASPTDQPVNHDM